ncbi:GNAT family N-acetyltransferase [Mesorhizobium sp. 1M-11]|uniref:GNAT family N-acetyltransferase n=1 Tax=Mesorhizobium sp. 1M-11 TaxID=1529006 RepID=UPI0006C76919|nr:GNAT family N-acetyltransferase [Mesorhizobium sp. 1M-11]
MTDGFTIRALEAGDPERIAATDGGPAWNADPVLWQGYLADAAQGRRVVLIAFKGQDVVGYGTLLWQSGYPPFKAAGIPEINNLVVAQAARGGGIATGMIGRFEQLAASAGKPRIGLGVGLYADYGAAQRLYVRLGYLPDGRGITYGEKPVAPDQSVRVDDDLILWLTKSL